jgi:hypothetical protein
MTPKRKRKTFGWKQHFHKIPQRLDVKFKQLRGQEIVVAVAKKVRASDIAAGTYAHLGISIANGKLVCPPEVVPPSRVGRYSLWNVEGREIVLKDAPKVTKSYSWEAPNYGDWTNGSHDVTMDREVYQRKLLHGQQLGIAIELLSTEESEDKAFVLRFAVVDSIGSKTKGAVDRMFFNVNLLQENVGAVDIFPTDAGKDQYLQHIHLTWQLLPPGDRDTVVQQIISKFKNVTPEIQKIVASRYDTLVKLTPIVWITGTDGFLRYFGAQFLSNLVVFENLEYGNATYLMYEDWPTLSKLSRTELLRMEVRHFDRIIHGEKWKSNLVDLVTQRKKELGANVTDKKS